MDLVRFTNYQATGGAPVRYIDGRWVKYTGGAFRVSGAWSANIEIANNAPQGGHGDPAGTTDGTGGNAYHNNVPASIACYCWKRTA